MWQKSLRRLSAELRSTEYLSAPVIDRVGALRRRGYIVERVRHYGSKVGDIHKLKSGELRLAIDAPRGLYRTAWAIIFPPLANVEYKY